MSAAVALGSILRATFSVSADFDRPRLALMRLQPNFRIYKPGKVLHPVQNRLNL